MESCKRRTMIAAVYEDLRVLPQDMIELEPSEAIRVTGGDDGDVAESFMLLFGGGSYSGSSSDGGGGGYIGFIP